MHALVVEVEIQDDAEARKGLEDVVATVKQAPGFVAGYWIRRAGGLGTSVVVFETEEQAHAAKPPADGFAPGVEMTSVSFGEVLASA